MNTLAPAAYAEETELELAQVATHDTPFARGYLLGYLRAKLEAGGRFEVWALESQMPVVQRTIGQANRRASVISYRPNRYGVRHVRLLVAE